MIKADHKKWARIIFDIYIDRLLKKNFSNFFLANNFQQIEENYSLILTPNHISWWDGFFIDYIVKKLSNRKFHIMMLEEQLERYWFFQKLGAYSIDPENKSGLISTVKYTNEILKDKNNLAVIYPQGTIETFEKRPLKIKEGLKLFMSNFSENLIVVPVAFKIQYYDDKDPAIITRFGKSLNAKMIKSDFDLYINEFHKNLDELSSAAFNKIFTSDLFIRK